MGASLIVWTRTVCGESTPPPRLAIIAMGKCGARELNYVSDVDVIFVAETADAISTRVAGEAMRFGADTFFGGAVAIRPSHDRRRGRSGERRDGRVVSVRC